MWTLIPMNLNDLALFVQAVDSGGFAPASNRFGVPKSTLSKRVAALEAGLEVRLIERNSRSFRLTEIGRGFYLHARAALMEVESAEQLVHQRLAEPSGTVRLTGSVPVVQFQLAPHFPAMARAWPRLRLDVRASDRFVDLLHEGYDIAVRSHFAPLPDSGLVQRTLAVEPVLLVVGTAYLRENDTPRKPSDLAAHSALLTAADATRWVLSSDKGETQDVQPQARMSADESVTLLLAATAGLGIACLPESICSHHLERGELVRVLPGWTAGTVTTTALMPHRRSLLPSVRAVLEFLVERLGSPLPA
jgi:DNA-binding transcriptional LysR family regulator